MTFFIKGFNKEMIGLDMVLRLGNLALGRKLRLETIYVSEPLINFLIIYLDSLQQDLSIRATCFLLLLLLLPLPFFQYARTRTQYAYAYGTQLNSLIQFPYTISLFQCSY